MQVSEAASTRYDFKNIYFYQLESLNLPILWQLLLFTVHKKGIIVYPVLVAWCLVLTIIIVVDTQQWWPWCLMLAEQFLVDSPVGHHSPIGVFCWFNCSY